MIVIQIKQNSTTFLKTSTRKIALCLFLRAVCKIEEANYKMMIMSLESCIQQETEIQNRTPKDWVATIRFENGQIKVYFMALSYYQ
jgi:hypothetical protein